MIHASIRLYSTVPCYFFLLQAAVKDLLERLLVDSDLTTPQLDSNRDQILEDYSHHILNESCTTVTNTTAKTAVQLVFGKANLVLVRPSPASEDSKPVQISARKHDSTILITVFSSWYVHRFPDMGFEGGTPASYLLL